MPRSGFAWAAVVSLCFLFVAAPVHGQDVYVDDGGSGGPGGCDNPDETTISGGVSAASPGDVVFVCPGTYTEQVSVSKSLTLEGNNAGTPGDGSRDPESVVDGEDGIGVHITTTGAVTVDGFQFEGDRGVVHTGGSSQHDQITITNNRFRTDEFGARLRDIQTGLNGGGITVSDNFTDLTQQVYDKSGSEAGATGIALRTIDGSGSVTVEGNDFQDGSDSGSGAAWYGIVFDGVKVSSGDALITGGSSGSTMQGLAQAIAILDGEAGEPLVNTDGDQTPNESDFKIEGGSGGLSASSFTGSSGNSAIDFHAGVFVYTGGKPGTQVKTTGNISNITVTGTGTAGNSGDGQPSAGLYFGGFSTEYGSNEGNFDLEVTATNVTVQDNDNRGVFARGADVVATVEQSTITGNGDDPFGSGGNFGFGVIARKGADLTVKQSEITNPSTSSNFGSTLQSQQTLTVNETDYDPILTVTNCKIDRNGLGDFFSGGNEARASGNAWLDGGTLITSGSTIASNSGGSTNDFTPFLENKSDQQGGTPGFQGDFSSLTVTAAGNQLGSTGRIQEGVNLVDNSTVNVESGTFAGQATLDKAVTLSGMGSGSDATSNTVLEGSGNGSGLAVTASNVTVQNLRVTNYVDGIDLSSTMSNLTFTNVASVGNAVRGATIGGGADIQNLTLDGVDFSDNSGDGNDGIRAATASKVDELTITNSHFDNNGDPAGSSAGSGIEVYQSESNPGMFTNVTIENTTFNNNSGKGLYLEKLSNATLKNVTISNSGTDPDYVYNNGIDLNLKYDDYSDITIKNSTFDNSGIHTTADNGTDFASALAIKARGQGNDTSYENTPATLSDVMVKGNTFSFDSPGTEATSVRVGEPGAGAAPEDVTLRSNKLSDGSNIEVDNVTVSSSNLTIDASGNWWGTTDEGTISSSLTIGSESGTGAVDVTPFLNNGTDTDGGTPGFQGDFSTLNVTTVESQVNSSGRINEGIGRADASGTVNVKSGTYAERVIVDKGVTLSGPNAGVDAVDGNRSAEAIIDPGGGTLGNIGIDVKSNLGTTTVDGFKVQNYGGGGIIMGSSDSGTTLHVLNNVVNATDSIGKATIQVAGDNSTVIGNDVEAGSLGKYPGYEGAGILVAALNRGADVEGVVVRDNAVHGGDAAVGTTGDDGNNGQVDEVKGTTIEENTITNNKIGVNVEKRSVNTSIQENTIDDNDVGVQVEHLDGLHPAGTQVLENKIINSVNFGAEVRADTTTIPSDYVLNVSANWWGTTDESTISSSLTSGSVDVTPFLDSGTDTDGGTPGFQGDFSTLNVTAVESQSGSTGRISEGNNRVDGGGTVNVTAGTYTPADVTVQENTVLESGADVSVSTTLTLSDGTFDVTNGTLTLTSTSETSTAAIAGSGSGTVTGEVTFERYLDKSDDATHFRFLSSPTATKIDDEGSGNNAGNLLSNMWTQSQTGKGADIAITDPVNSSVYTFNEAAHLDGAGLSSAWRAVGLSNDGNSGELNDLTEISGQANIDPGRGFMSLLYKDWDPTDETVDGFPITLSVTGSVQPEENGSNAITPPITFTGGDGDGVANNGWNLIANPFMAPIDWEAIEDEGLDAVDATIYVWDAGANQYASYTAGGGTGGSGNQDQYIAPFQAFFVKATGSGSGGNGPDIGGINSDEKAIGESPALKNASPSDPAIALELRAQGDSTGETTAFRFSEGAALDKDAYDAYQLKPLAASYALVASKMASTDALFDHQNRPKPAEQDTIELALQITQSGTYTLGAEMLENLPGDWGAILKNTDSGTLYDLTAGEEASFEYTAPESTSSTASPSSPAKAMLKNGGPTVATAKSKGSLPSFRLFVGPATIPVELASFDATTEGTTVHLTWKTISETDNAGFAVERRVGVGGTWSEVGFRDGAGTTSEPRTYQFADADVPFEAERVTYRLRQEDLDGTTTLSDKVTVQLGAPVKSQLYAPHPNPASQRATLRYEVAEAQPIEIAIFDMLGRRVETVVSGEVPVGRKQKTVRTEQLAPGVYFVRMRIGDEVRTERLTVVR